MYARVTIVQVQPDKIDEAIRIAQETVPLLRQQPGFHELTVLADRQTGHAHILSLWQSEAELRASETGVYQEGMARLAALLVGPPRREELEVLVHDHPG